jgi:Golgi nucleoside diphosphatase
LLRHAAKACQVCNSNSVSIRTARRARTCLAMRLPRLARALTLAVAGFVSLATGVFAQPFSYGLMFDAGSSGTRLSIFRWATRDFAEILPPPLSTPLELVSYSNRSVAGIDTAAGQAYLPVLLAAAQAYLANVSDPAQWAQFPVFLKATAGLRMLPQATRDTIMAAVRALLSNRVACPFLFQPSWARVISGEEEGVYGWLTVNYMAGTLQNASSE